MFRRVLAMNSAGYGDAGVLTSSSRLTCAAASFTSHASMFSFNCRTDFGPMTMLLTIGRPSSQARATAVDVVFCSRATAETGTAHHARAAESALGAAPEPEDASGASTEPEEA